MKNKKTDTEQKPQNKQDNKKILLVLAVSAAVMVLLLLLNQINFDVDISDWFDKNAGETEEVRVKLYKPDYESDIFENPEYLAQNRYISYTDPPSTTLIIGDPAQYGRPAVFWTEYFTALQYGDAERYNAMFTDEYYDTSIKANRDHRPYEKFTMQKIYDIAVEMLTQEVLAEGDYKGFIRYTFKVSYKIMENDGTFRADMPSDTWVPQIIELLDDETGNNIKINGVVKSTFTP